jgi:hypothetical protein
MRLMRELEVPVTPRDRLFRASRLHAILFVLVVLGICTAMILRHWPTQHVSYYICAAILGVLFLARRFVTSRFHPSNWLVRTGDDGLFIHYRSYLNDRMAPEDPTVVFLAYSDIRSARLVKERVTKRDMQNQTETEFLHWVEFELAVAPAQLITALADERGRPGAKEKRWYGSSTTLFQDYPVLMETPPFLCVRWQVVPRVSVLFDTLQPRVPISPTVKLSNDFANLQGLSRDEQLKRLRELNARGETIAATYLAQKIYGCDLTQATQIVKGLLSNQNTSETNLSAP